jgi:NAD(P)H-flavin reductase
MTDRAVMADPMLPRVCEVARRLKETAHTWTLELSPADGPVPQFHPGQFNMIYAFGIGEIPISISGDPARADRLVHTVRAVGAASRALCALGRGAAVGVRGPFGSSWPVEQAAGRDVLFVAGGIGLAPLRPALYRVLADRRSYGRVTLLYGTRTPAEILYRREVQGWRGRLDLDVEVTVDHAAGRPFEHVGVVTTLIPEADFDPAETTAFVCGPEVMMRFTVLELLQAGLSADAIHVSMERNMKCAVGLCGHCQLGPTLVCRDGPVFPYAAIERLFRVREL